LPDRLPVAVTGEFVVAGECDVNSEAGADRVEDLYRCVNPHLHIHTTQAYVEIGTITGNYRKEKKN